MVVERAPATTSGPQTPWLSRRVAVRGLCPHHLPRPRLHELLNQSLESRLALVVAPAGFGKTTLLKGWTREAAVPVAWLSPGAAEGHLRAFLHALMTAVQAVIPKFGDGVLTLLLMEHSPSTDVMALAIAGELADLPDGLTLVLDGYEVIGDTAVHQLLGTLLEHLPANVQIVVASRTTPPLPLARLRARGQLTEIGPAELRFLSHEAEALFANVAERELPEPMIRTLTERLGGWPCLLGLVALRLEQTSVSVAGVSMSVLEADDSRCTAALQQLAERDIEEFLIEEILESQPPDVLTFLLRASIVDAFNAELCAALADADEPVTGDPGILHRLERQHLLIESVDETDAWYRYPCMLRDAFRRHLHNETTPLEMMMLRRRACEWFAAHGMVDEAIEQALGCGDAVRVAELVEGSIEHLLGRGDYPTLSLRLGMLPPELVARRPRLILARAWLLNYQTRFEAIPTLLASLDAVLDSNELGLSQVEIERLRAEGDAIRALVATVAGDGQQVLAMARRAYEVLPRFSGYASSMAAGYVGIGRHLVGETDAAIAFVESTCEEDPEPNGVGRFVALWALTVIGTLAARPKSVLRWAGQLVREGVEIPEHVDAWLQYLQGLAYYELNRLSEARDCLLAAEVRRDPAHRLTLRNTLLGMAMVEQAAGDLSAASDSLQALKGLPEIAQNPRHLAAISVFDARLAGALGNVEAVRELLTGAGGDAPRIMLESISGSPSLVRARLLIGLGDEEDLAEAARLLDALDAGAASVNDRLQMIGVQATRALLYQARGDTDEALRHLEGAVASAAPNDLVRTFVDLGPPMQRLISELARRATSFRPYLTHLLEAFPSMDGPRQHSTAHRPGSRPESSLIEQLTWRETEVLRLLDARLSNQEIAGVLLISAETVKKHTSNIYQKLGVTGRREAVARSYALGILPAVVPSLSPVPEGPAPYWIGGTHVSPPSPPTQITG